MSEPTEPAGFAHHRAAAGSGDLGVVFRSEGRPDAEAAVLTAHAEELAAALEHLVLSSTHPRTRVACPLTIDDTPLSLALVALRTRCRSAGPSAELARRIVVPAM